MNRILIGLAASAVMLSASAGAFAQGSTGTGVGGTGSGGAAAGNTQGGTGAMTPEEQKKKAEMDKKGATAGAAADTSSADNTDASQSKRTGDDKPANSGSK